MPNNENVYVQNNEISAQFIIPMPTNRGDTYLYENNNTSNVVYMRNRNIDRMSVRILKTNNDFFFLYQIANLIIILVLLIRQQNLILTIIIYGKVKIRIKTIINRRSSLK